MINMTMTESVIIISFIVFMILYSSTVNESYIATLIIDICKIEMTIIEYFIIVQNIIIYLDQEKLNNISILSTYISASDLLIAFPEIVTELFENLSDFMNNYLNFNIFKI